MSAETVGENGEISRKAIQGHWILASEYFALLLGRYVTSAKTKLLCKEMSIPMCTGDQSNRKVKKKKSSMQQHREHVLMALSVSLCSWIAATT